MACNYLYSISSSYKGNKLDRSIRRAHIFLRQSLLYLSRVGGVLCHKSLHAVWLALGIFSLISFSSGAFHIPSSSHSIQALSWLHTPPVHNVTFFAGQLLVALPTLHAVSPNVPLNFYSILQSIFVSCREL